MKKSRRRLLALLLAAMLCIAEIVPVCITADAAAGSTVAQNAAVKITSHPKDVTAKAGGVATFTVAASGTGLQYQWQYSDDNGAKWYNSSVKSASYGTAANADRHGRLFRCIVTDSSGNKVTSNTARLLISGMLKIIVQPKDVTAKAGTTASFTVVAAGTGLQYQWQYSDDNGAKWYSSSVKAATYSTAANADRNGRLVRCIVTDGSGNKVTSNAARLLVGSGLAITSHPKDVTAKSGGVATFTVAASGTGLQYQWQISDNNGASWSNSSVKTASYGTAATADRHGRLFRCIVTDAGGNKVTSNAAQLLVSGMLKIIVQPKDVTAKAGTNATFTVVAAGSGLQYQWQYSDDNGAKWYSSSVKAATYSTAANADRNGRLIRCIVTDGSGNKVTSNAARLLVGSGLAITSHPKDVTAKSGGVATFTVAASGTGLQYQWQISDNNGASWSNSSVKTASYGTAATADRHGRLFRCIVTDAGGNKVTSNAARLLVSGMLKIIVQPKDVTAKAGTTASFTVVAAGTGLQYQWQFSDDNGAKWYASSVKAATYSTAASADRNGRMIRCIVSDSSGNKVTSNAARLLVGSGLAITTQPKDVTVKAGGVATFTVAASGTGLQYQWQYSDDNGAKWYVSSVKSASYGTAANADRHGRLFRCIVSDSSGNKVTSNTARLLISGMLKIIVQPKDVTAKAGTNASFTVVAAGTGLQYQWQFSDDNGAKWYTSSVKTATYSTAASADRNGRMIRCIVSDSSGNKVTSNAARLLVGSTLRIVTHPKDVTVKEGGVATFTVVAEGTGLQYQWQFSDDNGAKWYASSVKAATYSTAASADRNGRMIRCIVSDSSGSKVTSNAARLLVIGKLEIVNHPQDATAAFGTLVYFRVEATGSGLHYQWQYSDDGTVWTDAAEAGAIFAANTATEKNGRRFRCIVTDDGGAKAVSNAARLSISNRLRIQAQPSDAIAAKGETVNFTVKAQGNGLTYRWQYSDDNGTTWADSGVAKSTCSVTATEALHGRLVRCIVADAEGNQVISCHASLLIRDLIKIRTQPRDIAEPIGTTVSFSVDAVGKELRYRWQYSEDEGVTWNDTHAVTNVYMTEISTPHHGRLIRCVITDANGVSVISGTARMSVEGLLHITEQPKDIPCKVGDTVELCVSVAGTDLSYLWQCSTDGREWVDLDATDRICTLTVTEESLRQTYRCRVWDNRGNSCITDAVSLTDPDALILVQPHNWICGEGGYARFDIVVAENVVSTLWQMSSNNGQSWTNSSVNGLDYSTSATAEKSSWLYRCVVTDDAGRQQISDTVSFDIENDFVIAVQPEDASGALNEYVPFKIQVGGKGISYKWQISEDGETWSNISGTNTYRYRQQVTTSSMGQYVRCIVTNSTGETLTSDVVQLRWKGSGFFQHNGKTYYAKENGQIAKNLEYIGSSLYYFTSSGILNIGLARFDDEIYYFNEDGSAARGFVYIPNPKFGILYFDDDHTAAIGWTQIDGNTHYFYDTGVMAQGVTQIGGQEYYFDPQTGAQTYGLVQVGLNNYMYFPEGADQPFGGLKEVCGSLYYFSEKDGDYGVSLSGVQVVDGKTYYFDPETKRAVTGFVTYDDKVHYMDSDYAMVTDALISDGENTYLFNSQGTMEYGLVEYNGNYYYLDPETGAAAKGWVDLAGSELYFDPLTLTAKTGLDSIDGVKYYFTSRGYLKTGIIEVDGVRYCIAPCDEVKTGFVEINQNVYYVRGDQTVATGLTTIDGELYCFSANGVMRTGFVVDGKRYYFDPDTGAAVTGTIQLTNGYTYGFAGANGAGSGLTAINGALYQLNDSGIVLTGRAVINGNVYYFDPASGEAVSGWQSIRCSDGKVRTAYFDPKTFQAAKGLQTISGAAYFFDADGWAQTGEHTIGGTTYYFSPGTYKAYVGGTRPARSDEWGTLDGVKCFYGTDGQLLRGLFNIDGALYYFDRDGKMKTGLVTVDGITYYFGTSGAQHGQVVISGSEYYFSPSNFAMLTGLQRINGALYYYQESGIRKNGWITAGNGARLYMKADGLQTGLAVIDGKTYFFDTDGVMKTGVQSVTTESGTSMTCLLDENGVMVKGFVTDDGGTYYYDAATGARVTGLATVNGAQYYFYPTSGRAATGRCNIDGVYYYFDPQTAQRKYGFQNVNGNLYHFITGGSGVSRGLTVLDGKTYYFSEANGAALTGYRVVNGKGYYFDPETGAAVNKLLRQSNGYVYHIRTDGGLDQGWTTINGKSYFFYPSNHRMAEGLTSVGNRLYYFDIDRGVLRNTTVTVGGVTYKLDENGFASAVGDSDLAKLINEGIRHLDKGYGNEGEAENPSTYSCSQFVRQVFSAIGVDIPMGIDLQYYALIHGNYDCRIIDDISQAKAGDIVFYTAADCKYGTGCHYRNEIHHAGIYLGDGKLMDSNEIAIDGYSNGPVIRDLDNSSGNLIYKLVRIPGVNGS